MLLASSSLLAFTGGLLLACSSQPAADCSPGTAECMCSEQMCFEGLRCEQGICVDDAAADSGSEGASQPSDDSNPSGATMADSDDTADDDATADTGSDEETGAVEPGGPEIIDFGTNRAEMAPEDMLTFTATVIDPDGPDDIQGGSLKTPDESRTYGAFTDLGNGTYELMIDWDEIHGAEPINFDTPMPRTFLAVFFDNTGKHHSRTIDITLTCGGLEDPEGNPLPACDGRCEQTWDNPQHCGQCNNPCENCIEDECFEAQWSTCEPTNMAGSCYEICEAQGGWCPDFGDCPGGGGEAHFFPTLQCGDADLFGQCWEQVSDNAETHEAVECCCMLPAP